jgi:hypothetical protein
MVFVPAASAALASAATREHAHNPFFHDTVPSDIGLMNALQTCSGGMTLVAHTERECLSYCPMMTAPAQSLYMTGRELRPTLEYLRSFRFTDLSEQEAIMTGGETCFAEALRDTIDRQSPQLLVAFDSCVSRLIGDDSVAVVREAQPERRHLPTICVEIRLDDADNQRPFFGELVRELSGVIERTPGKAVNLVGFGLRTSPELVELERLLGNVGVRTNACLLPSFDIEEVRRLRDADCNVVMPARHIRNAFGLAQAQLDLPCFELPSPYGMAATRAWVESVAQALEVGPPSNESLWQCQQPSMLRWQRLHERAQACRVGVVLLDHDVREADFLTRLGVPWLASLEEMGFGLEVMIVGTRPTKEGCDQEFVQASLALAASLPQRSERHVTQVDSVDSLPEVLRDGGFELLYSEVAQDRRATAAGKVPFSVLDFEMGFEGALRTMVRLVRLAETPFFRRYRAHLPAAELPS